jgi:hypothetical protein
MLSSQMKKAHSLPNEVSQEIVDVPEASPHTNIDIAIILPDEGIVVETPTLGRTMQKRNGHYAKGSKEVEEMAKGRRKHACLKVVVSSPF